jgi:hypothetical protein
MAAYSEDQLKRLSEKAEHYIARRGGTMKPRRELVRDKTAQYYYNITTTTGIMETYEKDVHGDPRSPVNVSRLKGLFFGVLNDNESIYGDVRLSLPVTNLIDANTRLYFTDFYCVPGKNQPRPHYVTLVITRVGSAADRFCRRCLLSLDLRDNPFFKVLDFRRNVSEVVRCGHFHVELYYAEDVDIKGLLFSGRAFLGGVKMRNGMTSKRRPQPKSVRCPHCNLN